MYKEDAIKHLSKTYRRPQKHYNQALTEIFTEIKQKLADGKDVHVTGFGTFYTRMHKSDKGRNFKTKKPLEYKPVRLVGFHARGYPPKSSQADKRVIFPLTPLSLFSFLTQSMCWLHRLSVRGKRRLNSVGIVVVLQKNLSSSETSIS